MDNHGNDDSGKQEAPTTREWVRSLVIVLVIAAALTIGGLLLMAYMFGGCGTAYCS